MDKVKKLAEAIHGHKLVAVLDLPLVGLRRDELSKEYLTMELKKRLNLPQELNFEQIVELGLRNQGKERFLPLLNEFMNYGGKKAPEYYHILEELGVRYIIEAHYSSLFRMEMEKTGKSENCIFCHRNDDFAFHENAQVVISLFGKTAYHDAELILTENDYNCFFANTNSVSPSLRSIFKNTLLFIDFDSNSSRFKRIYDFMCQRNGEYPLEAFLVSTAKQEPLSYGSRENLTVIQEDASNFLRTISAKIRKSVPTADTTTYLVGCLPPVPYKYLRSYEQNEHAIFFGREKEVKELSLRVRGANQISIMTAISGYGKTSMINAGLIPALKKTGDYSVYYVRAEDDPWEGIIRCVFQMDPQEFTEDMPGIQRLSDKRYQLIIIDQFEECFVNNSHDSLHQIDVRMIKLLRCFPTLSLLISIRQDFYVRLSEFCFLGDAQITATYHLPPLSVQSALDAIQKPAGFPEYHFSYEQGLPEFILKGLSVQGDDGNACVDPTQLQIVCYFLYQELQIRGQTVISAEIYNEMGKAGGILENYIEESLKNYGEEQWNVGKEILKCLVSSKNTRVSKSAHEIYLEMSVRLQSGDDLEHEITYMLEQMIKARLLRVRIISEEIERYELTHEYIIHKINEWMDAETLKFKETHELFRVEYRKWFLYHGKCPLQKTIMPSNLYDEVQKYRDRIDFSPQEKSYLLLCLISYAEYDAEDMRYWISQNKGNSSCEEDLCYAMREFRGKKRIFAGVLLSVLRPNEAVFHKIYEEFSEDINPHLLTVGKDIRDLGEEIDETFWEKMSAFLDQARHREMCAIYGCPSVSLGLESNDRNTIVKKYELGKSMKEFFPDRVREVSLPFYMMDKYTVTNKQYAEFDEDHHYKDDYAEYPVVGILFEQAKAYAQWWGKDLPTEDEWEYAARGTDFRFFPWGDVWDYEAEIKKKESDKLCNTSLTGTDGARRVDEYPLGASPFGCMNMSGNVWEWTTTQAAEGSDRLIVKGGSWSKAGIMPWTWYRYSYSKESGYQNVGFRCVLR